MRSFIKTFEQFVAEEAINAGPESEVVIDDMITHNGTEISSEEILGIVISSDNDKQVEDKIREKYGELAFSTEDISKVISYYNDYNAEIKEKEKEKEEEAEGGEGDDPLAGI
jgi:hypothetical protein